MCEETFYQGRVLQSSPLLYKPLRPLKATTKRRPLMRRRAGVVERGGLENR